MSELRIVAAGGGNPTTTSRTFLNAGLNLTGADKPRIVVVPTAKATQAAHDTIVSNMQGFAAENGLQLEVLHGFDEAPDPVRGEELLHWADAAYFVGGDSRRMMRNWNDTGLAPVILRYVRDGLVTAIGISAGMVAWFRTALSDSLMYEVLGDTPWDYIGVDCLDMYETWACPHYDTFHPQTGQARAESFGNLLLAQPGDITGVACDNSAALQIVGERVSILNTGKGSAYRLHKRADQLHIEQFNPGIGELRLPVLLG